MVDFVSLIHVIDLDESASLMAIFELKQSLRIQHTRDPVLMKSLLTGSKGWCETLNCW